MTHSAAWQLPLQPTSELSLLGSEPMKINRLLFAHDEAKFTRIPKVKLIRGAAAAPSTS